MRAQDAGRCTGEAAASVAQRLAARLLLMMALTTQPAWGAGGLAAIDAFNIGRYYDASGEYAKAVSAYNDAIQRNPKLGVAYLARAKAYSKLGQHQLAIADCTVALRQHPRFADALVTRGDAYGAVGKYHEAMADLQQAVKLEPRNAVTLQHRGRIHQLLGQTQLAAADFKAALSIDPLASNLPPLVASEPRVTTSKAPDVARSPEPNRSAYRPARPLGPRAESSPPSVADAPRAPTAVPSELAPGRRNDITSQRPLAEGRTPGPPLIGAGATLPLAGAPQTLPAIPRLPRVREASGAGFSAAAAQQCFERGQQCSARQQWDAARAAFTQALDLDPRLTAAYGERGQAALASRQYTQAIADYDELLERTPGVALGYYDRGRAHAALGHWPQSLADFDAAIRLKSDNPAFYASRAEAQSMLGHAASADADRQAAASLSGNHANQVAERLPPAQNPTVQSRSASQDAQSARGVATTPTIVLAQPLGVDCRAGLEGLPAIAFEQLPQSLVSDAATQSAPQPPAVAADPAKPLSPEMGREIATVGDAAAPVVPASASAAIEDGVPLRDGRARLARLEQELQEFPGDADRYLQRAQIHADAGRPEDALADANAALRLAATNAEAFLLRAEIYERLTRFDAALVDYERAIELAPGSSRIYCQRARLRAARGAWQEAISDYDVALRLDPRSADTYCHRGFAWLRLGNQDQAKADFTAALTLQPDHCPAMLGRAQVGRLQGDLHAALAELDRVLNIDSRFAAAYVERSLCYASLGRDDRARADRSQAAELMAGNAASH